MRLKSKTTKPAVSWAPPLLEPPSYFNEIYDASIRYQLPKDTIFVFGSNLAGIHGAGAAKIARFEYGAKLGVGMGQTGRAYAIPTKDEYLEVLEKDIIEYYAQRFVKQTQSGERQYFVTAVGCGLAGYTPQEMAPFFKGAKYCWFPSTWLPYLF